MMSVDSIKLKVHSIFSVPAKMNFWVLCRGGTPDWGHCPSKLA
jgi:hypothetical protein